MTSDPIGNLGAAISDQIAARAIVSSSLSNLEGKSLIEIIKWEDKDEEKVEAFKEIISQSRSEKLLTSLGHDQFFTRHIIAAAALSAVEKLSDDEDTESSYNAIERVFNTMKEYLVEVYERMPVWNLGQHMVDSFSSIGDPKP